MSMAELQPPPVLRTIRQIGDALGLSERQVQHMIDQGLIKSAFRKGHVWFAPRTKLLEEFGVEQS